MPLFACGGGGAIAVFVSADFRALFPAFSQQPPNGPSDATLQAWFSLAGIWLRNDGTGPVKSVAVQTNLMYLLTAHLAQCFGGPNGNQPSGLVGRISSATEGSVTVATELESSLTNAWFAQTEYGLTFWQATAAYRVFARYMPGPTRFGNGIGTFGPVGSRFR